LPLAPCLPRPSHQPLSRRAQRSRPRQARRQCRRPPTRQHPSPTQWRRLATRRRLRLQQRRPIQLPAGGTYLTEQAADQVSANTYIGQAVYNGQNESIGNVNDLIMKKDGGLVAAVIGVGGFLGIGEKNVAVPMDKVTVAQNTQDGSVKLTTSETAETLKAAPEFKTLTDAVGRKGPGGRHRCDLDRVHHSQVTTASLVAVHA
jgi:sporulation protein YlmC with PRC-barrel domain